MVALKPGEQMSKTNTTISYVLELNFLKVQEKQVKASGSMFIL